MRLAQFWSELEDHFPPAGVRLSLAGRIGQEDLDLLIGLGVFAPRGTAQRYPCPRPGGAQCPRRIVDLRDGTFDAVCDNEPPECRDECGLSARDVEQLGLDMPTLARAIGRAFETGVRCEPVAGAVHAYRTGTFALSPGLDYPIYFVARASPADYLVALRSLVAANAKRGFGAMVPTDRHITDAIEREMRAAGVVVVPLARYLQIGPADALTVSVKPLELLRGIGRGAEAPSDVAADIVAVGHFREGRRELTKRQYDDLVASPGSFDVLIDQRGRRVWKKGQRKPATDVNTTYFVLLREVVASGRTFDPVTDSKVLEERDDQVQTFQRMRQKLDLKKGPRRTDDWSMLKTVRAEDGHAVYRFSPDSGLAFAILLDVAR